MIKPLLLAALVAAPMAHAAIDCMEVSKIATVVMDARQQDKSRAQFEELVRNSNDIGQYKAITLALIHDAYQRPAMRVKENQQREINRFTNQAYTLCVGR